MRRNCIVVSIVIVGFSVMFCGSAQSTSNSPGATSSVAPRERAIAKANDARKLFEEKKWAEAFTAFVEADALVHSPRFVWYMGRCQEEMGRFVEASRLYAQVLGETLPPKPSAAYANVLNEAQFSARREQERLVAEIPTVRIRVENALGRTFEVLLDGTPVTAAQDAIRVNPGKHQITITWGEGQTITQAVELLPKEHRDVSLEVPPPPPSLPPSVAPPVAPPTPTPREARKTFTQLPTVEKPSVASVVPTIALLGTGAISLTVGTVAGGYALKYHAEVKAHCERNTCLRTDKPIAERADTLALVADLGLITGGLASVAGLIWFGITKKPRDLNHARDTMVTPMLTPHGVVLTGRF